MNKTELRKVAIKLAIKKLNTKEVQKIKKQVCQQFVGIGEEQKECIDAFNKSFIKSYTKSFIKAAQ
jgi:hypothetical protein